MKSPRLSVCIPAYNRAKYLRQVLDSVVSQKDYLFEIVICEDVSPQRLEIGEIAREYKEKYGDIIVYHENVTNLGFDRNLRQLLKTASGDYCVFLGNDDVLCPGALKNLCEVIQRNDDVGVILRGYGWFNGTPDNVVQTVKYFPNERFMPAGLDSLAFFFRRSCVLAGLTVARQPALALESSEFDGSLFYQLHLVGNIILKHNGVFTPEIIALCRADEAPDFGHSSAEKGKYTPGEYTIDARIHMMTGIVTIAKSIEKTHKGALAGILRDIANYSFPWLAYHADKKPAVFKKYYQELGNMGLKAFPMFHVYYYLIRTVGAGTVEKMINFARNTLGYTPKLGGRK